MLIAQKYFEYKKMRWKFKTIFNFTIGSYYGTIPQAFIYVYVQFFLCLCFFSFNSDVQWKGDIFNPYIMKSENNEWKV